MRKQLLILSLALVALLSLGGGMALAGCGSCGGAPGHSHDGASIGSSKADAHVCSAACAAACTASAQKTNSQASSAACAAACTASAGSDAANACAATAAARASSSTAGKAGCSTAGKASCSTAGKASCGVKGISTASSDDVLIQNYFALATAVNKHCGASMEGAASNWSQALQTKIEDSRGKERQQLKKLARFLKNWPGDAKAQENRFLDISEWTASYCESNPDRSAGTKVVTCPTSGHRWVERESADDDSRS